MAVNSIGYAVGIDGVGQLLKNMRTTGGFMFVVGGWSAFTCGSMVMFELREIEKRGRGESVEKDEEKKTG